MAEQNILMLRVQLLACRTLDAVAVGTFTFNAADSAESMPEEQETGAEDVADHILCLGSATEVVDLPLVPGGENAEVDTELASHEGSHIFTAITLDDLHVLRPLAAASYAVIEGSC